ncbi:hypothetical protein RND81_08G037600 [Saponaria officinalis]|uniref:beta-galactosidase n=1 Tax=Saponaria officinalis TaxID=3572 RepID=A0AAW1J3L0_SAPOF
MLFFCCELPCFITILVNTMFTIAKQYWEDRLMRAKALGLNTIQTYVPWNLHEPIPGNLVFDGIADIASFLKLCQKLGFLVMLRPGPYICGEWDLGGFPAWLLNKEPALRLRSSDPAYLKLMENEYGSYGDDKAYLHHLVELGRRHLGNDVILYTTDGGTRETLEKGTIPGRGRLCCEFYTGWLTHWGCYFYGS